MNILWFDGKKNMGDLIGPWLASNIMNIKINKKSYRGNNSVGLCGSILEVNKCKTHWGTGLLKEVKLSKDKDIRAVRGPLTRRCCVKSGYDEKRSEGINICCDPGLAVPRFYNPEVMKEKKYKLGIIPHYVDKDFMNRYLEEASENGIDTSMITIIDIQTDVEDFVDRLLECESTISSSLHGIILSVAYGIPTRWVKMGNRLAGTGLKFYDFYLSLTRKEIGGEELNKYVELVTKYINKNITKEEVVNEAEDIGYMFPVNISEIEIKDIFSLPIIIKYNNDMVDKLLEVFPSDKIKL